MELPKRSFVMVLMELMVASHSNNSLDGRLGSVVGWLHRLLQQWH